ncbi:MAG: heme biosynthesis protein [Thermoprotei archaeon ex4572_64]|nr:MAG: heme biosynthesis protein [Thermoprotei archaeon ex4572_64]
MEFSEEIKKLLMKIQYDFPLIETPFTAISEELNRDEEWVLSKIRELKNEGVIKRIGATLNYSANNQVAALILASVPERIMDEFSENVNEITNVSHNFLRDHPMYNVWFVIKANSRYEIESIVSKLVQKFNINDYLILYTVRTYKLDVKFDLYRGISRTSCKIIPETIPTIKELGIPMSFFKAIKSIPIKSRPFDEILSILGKDVREILELIKNLISIGVLRDFYAVLDQEKIGFKENAVVVLQCSNCEKVAYLEETTHVVEREVVSSKWPYNCYFVVHGVDRRVIEDTVHKIIERVKASRYEIIYSIKNLLPEMRTATY